MVVPPQQIPEGPAEAPVPAMVLPAQTPPVQEEWIQLLAFCPEAPDFHRKPFWHNKSTGENTWMQPAVFRMAWWIEEKAYLKSNAAFQEEARRHWKWRTYGITGINGPGYWYCPLLQNVNRV